ncbi:hypothetical protein H4S01_003479 [Coemansia sp. RSA 2610]|nr:hypothetical protein H4S01_003479 [Coemansia sp. RSA 2610]
MPAVCMPDDILVRVFGWVKASTYMAPDHWEHTLPMLAVCSRWRWLAAPIVYASAFIVAEPPTPQQLLQAAGKPGRQPAAFRSNMVLALLTGNARCIRHLYIEANSIESAFGFLSGLARVGGGQVSWHKVRSLTLRQLCYGAATSGRTQRMQRRMTQRFVSFITKRMPRVRALECFIIDDSPQGSDIANRLADFYAAQLLRVKSLIPLSLSADRWSPHLTCLQMSIASRNGHELGVPRVCRETLKHLSLCNVPRDYKWAPFCHEGLDEEAKLVFASLESLEVFYQLDNRPNGRAQAARHSSSPARLHFPRLKHLSLFRCFQHCQLLESSVFPSHMQTVRMHCWPTLLAHMLTHTWKHIDLLDINVEPGVVSDPQVFLDQSNALFGKQCVAARSNFTVADIPEMPIANVDWSQLSALTVIYQLEVRDLLLLLDNMAALQRLTVLELEVRSLPARIIRDPQEDRPPPKSTRLHYAKLHAVDIKPCGPNYLAFLRYFAVTYSSLRCLSVSPSALFYTQALAKSCCQTHPHLSTATIVAANSLEY